MKKNNTKTKYFNLAIFVMGLGASHTGLAMGINQSELTVNCTGTLKVTGIKSQSIHGPFYDRAGNYHPASGYANFTVKVDSLDPSCVDVKEELGLELQETVFATAKTYKVGTPELLSPLAEAEVGKIYKFKTKQHFGYSDGKGFLPFYPLLSQQSLSLESAISVAPQLTVKPAKEYLLEDEKVEVTEAIFEMLKSTEYADTPLNNNLLYALHKNHPQYQVGLKNFVKQYLEVFSHYETKQPKDELFDFSLSILAGGVIEMTHEYPAYYEFPFPELLPKHPSLLMQLGKLPNITAIDLEEGLILLEQDFKSELVGEKVKKNYQIVLMKIAGTSQLNGVRVSSNHIGGALTLITSQKSKDIAKHLLATYYSN